jgi:hypothetical protein
MRYLLILALLGLALAGCSPRPNASGSATKEVSPNNRDIANVAPEGKLTETVPTKIGPPLPVTTANPTAILLTPVQGNTPAPAATSSASTGNWQTFTSAVLGVTVNYPSDWSVAEEADGATFTSPKGATIQLKPGIANPRSNEFKIGNQYCTSRTNQYGQTAEVCADNASLTYTANFTIQKADGSTQPVLLMTQTRTVGDAFEVMFNSLQPVK